MTDDEILDALLHSMSDDDANEATLRLMRDGKCITRATLNTKTGEFVREFVDPNDFRGDA